MAIKYTKVKYCDKITALASTLDFDLALASRVLQQPPERGFAIHRMRERFHKRLGSDIESPALKEKAYNDFKRINDSLAGFESAVEPEMLAEMQDFIINALENTTRKTLARRNALHSPQCNFDLVSILSGWSLGKGASTGTDATAFVEKTSEVMKGTKSVAPYRAVMASLFPSFTEAFIYAKGFDGEHTVQGSRLSTVPKNKDTLRTIAIEPCFNMALQLATGNFLEAVLCDIGIDITNQQIKNKELARIASVIGDTSFGLCTIDLKEASDRITLSLVKQLFPRDWYHWFATIRSPVTDVPGMGVVPLNMISTMGNGFTFPMMTLIMLAFCYASSRVFLGTKRNKIDFTKFGVFGDDIIAPASLFSKVSDALHSGGLLVNINKSYYKGYFYESCGGDFYCGHDVTPVYLQSCRTTQGIFTCINQLIGWSIKHNVCLERTLELLYSWLPPKDRRIRVPEWMSDNQGIRTLRCGRVYKYYAPVPMIHGIGTRSKSFVACCVSGYIARDHRQLMSMYLKSSFKTSSDPDLNSLVNYLVEDLFSGFYIRREQDVAFELRDGYLPPGFKSGQVFSNRDVEVVISGKCHVSIHDAGLSERRSALVGLLGR